jgi:hypothetical protein
VDATLAESSDSIACVHHQAIVYVFARVAGRGPSGRGEANEAGRLREKNEEAQEKKDRGLGDVDHKTEDACDYVRK